ncbi:Yip1 family protein [Desulfococcaceae bacterium HSG8]|nr:Yip1 family protein [Desulfococcaceae bacterium HSG8]
MNFKRIWQKKDFKEIWQTSFCQWKQIMINPAIFFNDWEQDEPWDKVITFNVICGAIAGILKTILTFGSEFLMIVGYPIIFIIITFVGGAIFFVFFKLSGGEGKFEPTIKMTGYTHAISIFSFGIPTLGPLIGLYQIWLLTLAGEAGHELDTRRAFIAVVIPLFLYLILMALIGTIIGVRFWGGVMSHEGL